MCSTYVCLSHYHVLKRLFLLPCVAVAHLSSMLILPDRVVCPGKGDLVCGTFRPLMLMPPAPRLTYCAVTEYSKMLMLETL